MKLFETRPLLLLIDVETKIILSTVPTVACGQMLMLGLLNTQMHYLPVQAADREKEWDAYDFVAPDIYYTMSTSWNISAAPENLVNPAIIERRHLVRQRVSYLHPWEVHCKGSLVRFQGYMSDGVQAFIRTELLLGPASSYIQEYASIHDIGLDNAVEELGSKVRSIGMIEARNWAQYEKIAQAMARASDVETLEQLMNQGFDTLYYNAFI
jgi:hypothetical protein